MVGPSRIADVDFSRKVLLDEFETKSKGTGTRESLGSSNSFFLENRVAFTEQQFSSDSSESSMTVDRKIFLVDGWVVGNFLLSISDNVEDVRLSLVVSVSTNADIDLLGVLVGFVGIGNTEDSIRRSQFDVFESTRSVVLGE